MTKAEYCYPKHVWKHSSTEEQNHYLNCPADLEQYAENLWKQKNNRSEAVISQPSVGIKRYLDEDKTKAYVEKKQT